MWEKLFQKAYEIQAAGDLLVGSIPQAIKDVDDNSTGHQSLSTFVLKYVVQPSQQALKLDIHVNHENTSMDVETTYTDAVDNQTLLSNITSPILRNGMKRKKVIRKSLYQKKKIRVTQ